MDNFKCLLTGEKGLGKSSKKPLHYKVSGGWWRRRWGGGAMGRRGGGAAGRGAGGVVGWWGHNGETAARERQCLGVPYHALVPRAVLCSHAGCTGAGFPRGGFLGACDISMPDARTQRFPLPDPPL